MNELKDMKLEELKALAYDQMVQLNQTQTNLSILNQEIQKRMSEPKKE